MSVAPSTHPSKRAVRLLCLWRTLEPNELEISSIVCAVGSKCSGLLTAHRFLIPHPSALLPNSVPFDEIRSGLLASSQRLIWNQGLRHYCSTTVNDLGGMGVGMYLYFWVIRIMAIFFALCALLSVPAMMFHREVNFLFRKQPAFSTLKNAMRQSKICALCGR